MAKENAADASCQSCCWQSICIRGEGSAGCLLIVAAFVFGWVPSACERESRLLAIAEVGLRRLRRLHVRARGGPPPLAYSFVPLRSQPAVLAWAEAHGRGARGRRAETSLPQVAGHSAPPWRAGWPRRRACTFRGKFLYWDSVSKGGGGTGLLKQLHTNAVTVVQHPRTPPPWWNSINVRFSVGAAAWSKSGEICLGGGVGCTG